MCKLKKCWNYALYASKSLGSFFSWIQFIFINHKSEKYVKATRSPRFLWRWCFRRRQCWGSRPRLRPRRSWCSGHIFTRFMATFCWEILGLTATFSSETMLGPQPRLRRRQCWVHSHVYAEGELDVRAVRAKFSWGSWLRFIGKSWGWRPGFWIWGRNKRQVCVEFAAEMETKCLEFEAGLLTNIWTFIGQKYPHFLGSNIFNFILSSNSNVIALESLRTHQPLPQANGR